MPSVGGNVVKLDNFLRMGILWMIALGSSHFRLLFQRCRFRSLVAYRRRLPVTFPNRPVCVVTGASSGIGKATAQGLALYGYHVILAGRSLTSLLEVVAEIKKKQGDASLVAMELDLCSVPSILHFTEAVQAALEFMQPCSGLQLLVNNAGILAASQRWTPDGFDSMMASNYLGPYLLTQQLLPLLNKNPNPRIVNVVSFTHLCVQSVQIDEEHLAEGSIQTPSSTVAWYRLARIYETSKFCLLLFTYELHRRLSTSNSASRISVLAADPGAVKTNLMRELPVWLETLAHVGLKLCGLLQCPTFGADAIIDAALAPEGLSGKYFFGGRGRTLTSSSLSYDTRLASQLWACSFSICNMAKARVDRVHKNQGS